MACGRAATIHAPSPGVTAREARGVGRGLGQNPPNPPCQGGTSPHTLILPPSEVKETRRMLG